MKKVSQKKPKKIKINPEGRIPTSFLMYTEKEGGDFHFLGSFTLEQYNPLINLGYVDIKEGDKIKRIYPAYACLCNPKYGFDFVIDETNGDRKVPKKRVTFISEEVK